MTYFADGTAYTYGPVTGSEQLVNIGWLDGVHPFPTGEVDPARIRVLLALCRTGVNRTRGFHMCELCAAGTSSGPPTPVVVQDDRGAFPVGGAEIRVAGPASVVYAAPDMVIHYVLEHGYAPPDDFLKALDGIEAADR